MFKLNSETKQLLKIAAITSPIIGIYSMIPIFLFVSSVPSVKQDLYFLGPQRLVLGISFISLIIFVQWIINIILQNYIQPKRIFARKKGLIILISYLLLFTAIFISHILKKESLNQPDFSFFNLYPFIGGFAFNTIILIILALTKSRSQRAELEIEKAQLEVAHLIAKQEHLKHKIQPHFLFNSLNTLKLLIKREPENAEKYVVRLSSFLRFSIAETVKDTATINNELTFCENYLELQKVRFRDSIVLQVSIPEEIMKNFSLPVFTLQTLAENAINHNAFTPANPLKIEIVYNANKTISVRNNLLPKFSNEKSTGTGLINLSKRFKLLLGSNPEIKKDEKKGVFEVSFKMIKNEYRNN